MLLYHPVTLNAKIDRDSLVGFYISPYVCVRWLLSFVSITPRISGILVFNWLQKQEPWRCFVTTVICCFDVVVSHSKCLVVPKPPPKKKKFEWGEKELDAMLEEKLCRSRNFSRCLVKKEKKGQTKKTITEEIHYLV